MAYADIYNAATDPNWQGRCLVAVWKAAQDILSEDPGTQDHQRRKAWAVNVLRDGAAITPKLLAMQVLRNETIAATPGDLRSGCGSTQARPTSVTSSIMQ